MLNNTKSTTATSDAMLLANAAETAIDLSKAALVDEYYYQSLPLCVIDSVYSIGVTYQSVRNVIERFCEHFGLQKFRNDRSQLPSVASQLSMSDFIGMYDDVGVDFFVQSIYRNRQRTSVHNGILKGEAVLRFAKVVRDIGAEALQDVKHIINNKAFAQRIKAIPGQRSGISLQYFFMLAGSDDLIKPDRMIHRFIERQLNKKVSAKEAQILLSETSELLQTKYSQMTPRLLDYTIGEYQRGVK